MKTILISIITAILMLPFYSNAAELEFKLEEEKYVDDIPFCTSTIATIALFNQMGDAEEAYVDDIPFNTRKLYFDYLAQNLTNTYQNEKSVMDIPFNTSALAMKVIFEDNLMADFRSETNSTDIPFDTRAILYGKLIEQQVADYTNEGNVGDIPFEIHVTECMEVACPDYTKNKIITAYTKAKLTNLTVVKPAVKSNLYSKDVFLDELIESTKAVKIFEMVDEDEKSFIIEYSLDAL